MITEERLAEIEARANAATVHRWLRDALTVYALHHNGDYAKGLPVMVNRFWIRVESFPGCSPVEAEANAIFIAAARTDVPDLIAEVRRLRAAMEVAE